MNAKKNAAVQTTTGTSSNASPKSIVVPGPLIGFKEGSFVALCADLWIVDLVFTGPDAESRANAYAKERNK